MGGVHLHPTTIMMRMASTLRYEPLPYALSDIRLTVLPSRASPMSHRTRRTMPQANTDGATPTLTSSTIQPTPYHRTTQEKDAKRMANSWPCALGMEILVQALADRAPECPSTGIHLAHIEDVVTPVRARTPRLMNRKALSHLCEELSAIHGQKTCQMMPSHTLDHLLRGKTTSSFHPPHGTAPSREEALESVRLPEPILLLSKMPLP